MTRDAKLKIVQVVPLLTSLVLMLIPAYRAHAAGVPAVTSPKECYFFHNWQYNGSGVTCWDFSPPAHCAICT